MSRRTFFFGLIGDEPYVEPCFVPTYGRRALTSSLNDTQRCFRPGIAVEFIREVCQWLGALCQLNVVRHKQYGDNSSGAWTGMMRQVLDGDFDAATMNFNPIASRLAVVDFSRGVFVSDLYLATRFPQPDKYSLTAIFAFRWEVWAAIAAAVAALGALALFVEARVEGRPVASQEELRRASWPRLLLARETTKLFLGRALEAGSVFLNQGLTRAYHPAVLFSIAVWGICCIVLTGTYSSYILVSSLAVRIPLPFTDLASFPQCMERGECRLLFETRSTSYYVRIAEAQSGPLWAIKMAAEKNPILVEPGVDSAKRVRTKDGPYLVSFVGGTELSAWLKRSPDCSIAAIFVGSDREGFPVRRKSGLLEPLNRAILELSEVGVGAKMYSDYVGNSLADLDKCYQPSVASKAMSLWNYVGCFLAFAVGSLGGLMAVLVEMSYRAGTLFPGPNASKLYPEELIVL